MESNLPAEPQPAAESGTTAPGLAGPGVTVLDDGSPDLVPPDSADSGLIWPTVAVEVRQALLSLPVVGVVAVLGAPLGLLWQQIAPSVALTKTSRGWFPAQEEPEGFIADDGWFAIVTGTAGIALAVLAWILLRRLRGPAMLVALAAGSLAGAFLAQWLGQRTGLAGFQRQVHEATVGTTLLRPPKLGTQVVNMVQPTLAAATYTLLAALHYASSLMPEPILPDSGAREGQLGSDADGMAWGGSDEFDLDEHGSDEHGSDEHGSDEHGSDEHGAPSPAP